MNQLCLVLFTLLSSFSLLNHACSLCCFHRYSLFFLVAIFTPTERKAKRSCYIFLNKYIAVPWICFRSPLKKKTLQYIKGPLIVRLNKLRAQRITNNKKKKRRSRSVRRSSGYFSRNLPKIAFSSCHAA